MMARIQLEEVILEENDSKGMMDFRRVWDVFRVVRICI